MQQKQMADGPAAKMIPVQKGEKLGDWDLEGLQFEKLVNPCPFFH